MEFLRQDGIKVDYQTVIKTFQNYYLGPRWEEGVWEGFITKEPLLASDDFIHWVRDRHFSVFTGRPKDEAFYVMRRLDLFDNMQHLVAMHDVTQKKPHPEGIHQIMSLNGYCNALSCGDTLDDLNAAKAAGISFVGILPPHPEAKVMMKNAFTANGCAEFLESINDLPAYIENLSR